LAVALPLSAFQHAASTALPPDELPLLPEDPLDPELPLLPELPPEDPLDPELPLLPEDPLDPELPLLPELPPEDPLDPELPLLPELPPEDPLDPELPPLPPSGPLPVRMDDGVAPLHAVAPATRRTMPSQRAMRRMVTSLRVARNDSTRPASSPCRDKRPP